MLIPAKLKGAAARKYYDFAATYEMNSLHLRGISGVRFLLYGVTLDTPGRRELLSMQAVQAFYPCHQCLHTWQPGLRTQIYGGYRRFLPVGHPWRAKTFVFQGNLYQFRDVESRVPPTGRTDALVSLMLSDARPNRPKCGHKSLPFLHRWVGADWGRCMPDNMHDLKCFAEMTIKGLVGPGANGMYKGWSARRKDEKHRMDCEVFDIFAEFADGTNPVPPWRLTKDAVKLMDRRVQSMWWPHYVDKLCRYNQSFWSKPDRMWKSVHKSFALLIILPTCLHGFVKTVHLALLYIVDSLRQLTGEVLSTYELRALGVESGARRVISKHKIECLGRQLLRGLLMLEGSFPVAHLNPALHHVVHYAAETARVGILDWVNMLSFERNNKRMKNLVRSSRSAEVSLANSIQVGIVDCIICVHHSPVHVNYRSTWRRGL